MYIKYDYIGDILFLNLTKRFLIVKKSYFKNNPFKIAYIFENVDFWHFLRKKWSKFSIIFFLYRGVPWGHMIRIDKNDVITFIFICVLSPIVGMILILLYKNQKIASKLTKKA